MGYEIILLDDQCTRRHKEQLCHLDDIGRRQLSSEVPLLNEPFPLCLPLTAVIKHYLPDTVRCSNVSIALVLNV